MTKRGYIRLFSYAIAFALLLSSRAIINMTTANSYKAQLELNYQQSLNELSENLDSIETNLTKSIYSNAYGYKQGFICRMFAGERCAFKASD